MLVTKKSQLTGDVHQMELPITKEDLDRYHSTPGLMIQHAFPRLSAIQREFIMTGITAEEWNRIFPPGEECS